MDVALMDNKTVTQVWRNSSKEIILGTGFSPKGMGTLQEFEASESVTVGMILKAGKLILPESSELSAESLTRRQLLIGLLRRGFITADEAMADPMVLPAILQFAFSQIGDPAKQAEAMIEWRSAGSFEKSHPLFMTVLAAREQATGKAFDAKAVDAFFAEYSQI